MITLSPEQKIQVKKDIIAKAREEGFHLITQLAYILATIHFETVDTFTPKVSNYWREHPDTFNKINKPEIYPYYARGYTLVLEGKPNYSKLTYALKHDLINYPMLLSTPTVALEALLFMFKGGCLTNIKLEEFINEKKFNFKRARYSLDKEGAFKCDIATLADYYYNILRENPYEYG